MHTRTQLMNDLHTLNGIDVGVQIGHLDIVFFEIAGEIFRHAFGQSGNQYALIQLAAFGNL